MPKTLMSFRINDVLAFTVVGNCVMCPVLYLVRHCQATGQHPNAPLSELGKQQAIALADWFENRQIGQIVTSPFVRAYQSVVPLANRLDLTIEVDDRLIERVLSPIPFDNWRERLAETFRDLDLRFEGGESSRTAMMRGVVAVREVMEQATEPVVIVTHGNLMTLILKHFNPAIGYFDWERLQTPDVYSVQFASEGVFIERMIKAND